MLDELHHVDVVNLATGRYLIGVVFSIELVVISDDKNL